MSYEDSVMVGGIPYAEWWAEHYAEEALAARAPEVLARCEAATKAVPLRGQVWFVGNIVDIDEPRYFVQTVDCQEVLSGPRLEDVEFAAHARTDLPAMTRAFLEVTDEADAYRRWWQSAEQAHMSRARQFFAERDLAAEFKRRYSAYAREHEAACAKLAEYADRPGLPGFVPCAKATSLLDRIDAIKAERDRLRNLADGLADALDVVMTGDPSVDGKHTQGRAALAAYRDATKETP